MSDQTNLNQKLTKVGLPGLVFMFTVDQIASMMNVSEDTIRSVYLYFQGRSTGIKRRHMMTAVNVAPENEKPNWRVSLEEYRLWLKRMGFKQSDITRM